MFIYYGRPNDAISEAESISVIDGIVSALSVSLVHAPVRDGQEFIMAPRRDRGKLRAFHYTDRTRAKGDNLDGVGEGMAISESVRSVKCIA